MNLNSAATTEDLDVEASQNKDGLLSSGSALLFRGLKWGFGHEDTSHSVPRGQPVDNRGDPRASEEPVVYGGLSHDVLGWCLPQSTDYVNQPRNPIPIFGSLDSILRGPSSSQSSIPPAYPGHMPPPIASELFHERELPLPENQSSLVPHDGLSQTTSPPLGQMLPTIEPPKPLAEWRIPGAGLHSHTRYPLPKCHPGTRHKLLHTLETLSCHSERSQNVFWLFGPAGSGKSALAQTFAESCGNANRLAAAVFFSRTKGRDDVSRVVFTIAHQLAARNSAYNEIIRKVVENEPHIFEEDLSTQYDRLVYRPSLRAKLLNEESSPVIVLDGLDECSDRRVQGELVELIGRMTPVGPCSPAVSNGTSGQLTPSFLWLICSRPEPHIKDLVAKHEKSTICGKLSLDDAESVSDVRQILISGFRDVRERFPSIFDSEEWPSSSQLGRLSDITSGFVAAALSILAFVGDAGHRDPKAQLVKCLDFFDSLPFHPNIQLATIANPFHDLDTLYILILADVEPYPLPMAINILRLCASNGAHRLLYTAKHIADTLRIDQSTFYRVLQSLHSVVDVPPPEYFDIGYPRFYHSSFPDFLRDAVRSGPFTIQPALDAGEKALQESSTDMLLSPRSVSFDTTPESSETSDDDDDVPSISEDVEGPRSTRALNPPVTVTLLTEKLASVLQKSRSRKALHNLQGPEAQLMVNFIYNVVGEEYCPIPWLQKHALIALYRLSKATLMYPHCYVLKDIEFDSHESGGAFSDIHRGHYGEQQLCLKVVRLHQKSDTDAMLKIYAKEAILWGQLHHPNIVPFYGIYYLNDARRQVCLVSPWMRHGNLVDYLKRNPSTQRTPFVYDVTAGLAYMHSRGLVHSDLKGLNVLVNDSGCACITDFGLSFIRTDQTLAYTIAATTVHGFSYHWAAPELLDDGARATMASDVWALGCVYYEILMGKLPYHGLSDAQIIRRLDRGILPSRPHPGEVNKVENIIWNIVEHVWITDAEQRPRCREILSELELSGFARLHEGHLSEQMQCDSRRSFQEAMKHGKEMPIDLKAVGNILDVTQHGHRV